MRNTIITTALAALSLAAIATPAAAETTSVSIAWQDLNLTSPDGQATLEDRIEAAIDEVCPRGEVRRVSDVMDAEECREQAEGAIREQVIALLDHDAQLALNGNDQSRS